MGEGVVLLAAADWAAAAVWCGGVTEAEDALLAPCIISSAISVTGSFRGTFGADSVSKNWTNACARDWSRAADDDEDVDPCLSHPRPPPSSPDLCLSSALKSRTVAITLRTSGRFAASAAAYPTTRFLTRHLSTLPALWFDAELISSCAFLRCSSRALTSCLRVAMTCALLSSCSPR